MSTAAAKLEELCDVLIKVAENWRASDEAALTRLQDAAEKVSESWSGSWIGYHAYVYYDKLQPPLPGDHFSAEWGLMISSAAPTQRQDGMEIALMTFARLYSN